MFTREKVENAVFWYLTEVLPVHVLLITTFYVGVIIGAPEVCP